ncbi:heat stress transcription factor A-4b-like [Syzygium oleosum]|uniref:heat stress transcription factor A-4b-like n=1 Tax=Syzygium oleosum TaxID=219896 RepID=UPI0011D1F71E|nr:heat stress transcription factor A-4b-like [Syzygium oleosum]
MDGSQGKSNAPAPFLVKTYEMVDDPQTEFLVSWSESGCSFVVWNPPEFSRELLPKYFKHNNFSSFVRQLNTYGFRKIDPDQWEFANEEFIRGEKHLLINIYRRKPIHSHSGQSVRLTDTEKQAYEEEIRRLQHEKSLLQSELQRYQGQNPDVDFQIQLLRKQFQSMEQKQTQLMAFLAKLMQKPVFASLLTQQLDIPNKKRRLPELDHLHDSDDMNERESLKFHNKNPSGVPFSLIDMDSVEKLEQSLHLLENLLQGVDNTIGVDHHDFGALSLPSPAGFTGRKESSDDSDGHIHLWSPGSPPSSKDIASSPELALGTDHVESPETSSVCLNMDISLKSSVIDVNVEPPCIHDVDNLKEQILEKMPGAPTAVNDVFWEQFLTEAPCPTDSQEVQSERREGNGSRSPMEPANRGKFWLNSHYGNDFTKHVGSLASEGRS